MRVLVADESALFREYVAAKLEPFGVTVVAAADGQELLQKLAHPRPDLVISDYFLPGRALVSVLKAKNADPATTDIPVLVCCGRLNRDRLVELSLLGVRRVFTKPLKIDQLWAAVGDLLGRPIPIDDTPCILDAHVNENVIFVEVALGLNEEKINLLGFKIQELMDLHRLALPKFLVMLSSLTFRDADLPKIRRLFTMLVNLTRGRVRWVKVLTQSKAVEVALKGLWEFGELSVTDSLQKAMDELLDRGSAESFLQGTVTVEPSSVELRFEHDRALEDLSSRIHAEGADLRIAVVDDDFIVQEIVKNTFGPSGATILTFDDGAEFLAHSPPDLDLILLDLMMPGADGFEVMDRLQDRGSPPPIIVLSALSKRDTVLRAMGYGIRSYMTKPLKPEELLRKTLEVARSHF